MSDPGLDLPSATGDPADDSESIEIGQGWRYASAAIGALGLGFGGWAVFVTQLEAGPVALLGIGLVFAMIAMAGALPWRIKFGDTEIELRRAKRKLDVLQGELERVAATADPAELQPVLERLDLSAPDVSQAMRLAKSYEQLAIDSLRASARAVGGDFLDVDQMLRELRRDPELAFQRAGLLDGVLRNADGASLVAVEIRASLKGLSGHVVDSLVNRFRTHRSVTDAKMLLLVLQSEPAQALQHLLGQYSDVRCVVFAGPDDQQELITLVQQLLRKPT